MAARDPVRVERNGAVARVVLARPEVHNAFDDRMIAALTGILEELGADPAVRLLVLCGEGRSFSAGADLAWMRRMAEYDFARNLEDARALERMLRTLDRCPKPTIARVHGAALGGGVGLVAACDIAVASAAASFALSEVRLGLVPAVVSPFVLRAMGPRACRRYFLTGERFTAFEALRLGLVHEVVAEEALDRRVEQLVEELLKGGPEAQAEAKNLLRLVPTLEGSLLAEATAKIIAERRAAAEGREGIAAFLEKRAPAWRKDRAPRS